MYKATISTTAGDIIATWNGREYIQLFFGADMEDAPSAVINVFDYSTNEPRIPITVEAMINSVREWLIEQEMSAHVESISIQEMPY